MYDLMQTCKETHVSRTLLLYYCSKISCFGREGLITKNIKYKSSGFVRNVCGCWCVYVMIERVQRVSENWTRGPGGPGPGLGPVPSLVYGIARERNCVGLVYDMACSAFCSLKKYQKDLIISKNCDLSKSETTI